MSSRGRILSLVVLVVMGFAGPAPAALRQAATGEQAPAIIDASLSEALAHGGTHHVIVSGRPHEGVTKATFPDRAQAMRELTRRSQPFFNEMRSLLGEGTWLNAWPAAPAIELVADARAIERMAVSPRVSAIGSPGTVRVDPIPDDDRLHSENSSGRKLLEAEQIWALGYRGEGIKISVVDTGIDPTHEAFKEADGSSRVEAFRDFVLNRPAPYDDNGHGTHVAGTALGSSVYNDAQWGIFQETGVAPEARLIVAKFLDANGGGTFANAMSALQWSFDNGADISSNSWGGTCSSSIVPTIQLLNQLTDLGMVSVFAAGNSGTGGVGGPGCAETVITVGAIDENKVITAFSSRGPCSDPATGTGSRICPDVVAEGTGVRSSIPRAGATYADPSGYKTWQGTSMATPHIAGALALAEQMKRALTGSGWDTAARAEERLLKAISEDLGVPGEDNTYGWGLPKLTKVHDLLTAPAIPNITHQFGVAPEVVRQGNTTVARFAVTNIGTGIADGTLSASIKAPDGSTLYSHESQRNLGLFDGDAYTKSVTIGSDTLPGTYTFIASYAYSYTDPNDGPQTRLIERETTFSVVRASVDMGLDGFAATAPPLVPQPLSFGAISSGNEPAYAVTIEVTFPDRYAFIPGANFDPTNAASRYSNPAPKSVREDRTFGRITLTYNVGDLPVGQAFGFTTTVAPTTQGEYRVLAVAKYKDGAGKSFTKSETFVQQVALPQ